MRDARILLEGDFEQLEQAAEDLRSICGDASPIGIGRSAERAEMRGGLVEAGVESARSGGPDAVVLREVTRMVGVVPNAAYRHFPVPRRRDQQEHLRCKDAVDQALRVRGSRDFADRGSYDRP